MTINAIALDYYLIGDDAREVWEHYSLCPFCGLAAHARACPELRSLLFAADPADHPADDPPIDIPDEYPDPTPGGPPPPEWRTA